MAAVTICSDFGAPQNKVWHCFPIYFSVLYDITYMCNLKSWTLKNWCFWTVMLEKTLESPLDCKEIQPVHPKGDQSWVFTERTGAESDNPNILATWCEELTHGKRPWCWERLKAGGEGGDRGWDGWMASLTWWTWVWASPGVGDGQGSLECYSPWGHKE